MFNYWSAPTTLLRAWACPEEPSAAADGRFRFGSSAKVTSGKEDSRLSRLGCSLRALLFSRAVDPQMPAC